MFFGADRSKFKFARHLRTNMTIPEQELWYRLRKKQLGIRFKPQHPIGNFIVDFYSHKLKLVIEIDGEIHKYKKIYDKQREQILKDLGLDVIRFSNNEVLNKMPFVLDRIREKINCQNNNMKALL